MRLVDADHFHDKIDWEDEGEVYFLEQYLFDEPTVDAVPVVRCKDCKYKKHLERCFDRKGNQLYYCDNDYGLSAYLKEYFFCCLGERKDAANEDNI